MKSNEFNKGVLDDDSSPADDILKLHDRIEIL